MAFLGVYRAIYDYVPQSEGELTITEGDLLFVLDNNSDVESKEEGHVGRRR
jgi:hypothetical protein